MSGIQQQSEKGERRWGGLMDSRRQLEQKGKEECSEERRKGSADGGEFNIK